MPQSGQNDAAPGANRSRLDIIRTNVHQLFTGRSTVGARSSSPDSPKTPRIVLGLGELPSTRIHLPQLSSHTPSSTRSHHASSSRSDQLPRVPSANHSISHYDSSRTQNSPQTPHPRIPTTNRPFNGVGPEEQHLAAMAFRGSRKRHQRSPRRGHWSCFSTKNRKNIRSTAIRCIISGTFLLVVLSIYLALALSNKEESQEFHVFLILTILVTTIFFCHALIRLCLVSVRPAHENDRRRDLTAMVGPGGYANPPEPIPVSLARDEEAIGVQSEATKYPPPAYGLWRESVRVDPNRLYWQRRERTPSPARGRQPEETVTEPNRPPSYVSDDGVGYVLEPTPRSIARELPLPPPPSARR